MLAAADLVPAARALHVVVGARALASTLAAPSSSSPSFKAVQSRVPRPGSDLGSGLVGSGGPRRLERAAPAR